MPPSFDGYSLQFTLDSWAPQFDEEWGMNVHSGAISFLWVHPKSLIKSMTPYPNLPTQIHMLGSPKRFFRVSFLLYIVQTYLLVSLLKVAFSSKGLENMHFSDFSSFFPLNFLTDLVIA